MQEGIRNGFERAVSKSVEAQGGNFEYFLQSSITSKLIIRYIEHISMIFFTFFLWMEHLRILQNGIDAEIKSHIDLETIIQRFNKLFGNNFLLISNCRTVNTIFLLRTMIDLLTHWTDNFLKYFDSIVFNDYSFSGKYTKNNEKRKVSISQ